MKSVPEGTTRMAMLKRGEADIAVALEGEVAEEVKLDPHLKLMERAAFYDAWKEKKLPGLSIVGSGG